MKQILLMIGLLLACFAAAVYFAGLAYSLIGFGAAILFLGLIKLSIKT